MDVYRTGNVTDPSLLPILRETFKKDRLPFIEEVVGKDASAYSNEADAFEDDFVTAFVGQENYPKLSAIKSKYDPNDLFIVTARVGSERWDKYGLCAI